MRWGCRYQFRLTLPRDGASLINTAADTLANPPVNSPSLRDLLDEFGPVEQNPALGVFTEYPGFAYRLELLVSTLTFHLPADKWLPGKIENGRIVPDPDLVGREDVGFICPRCCSSSPSPMIQRSRPTSISNPGAIRALMRLPMWKWANWCAWFRPLAIDKRGRWGFGVDQVLVDLSPDSTPPEILELYGAV